MIGTWEKALFDYKLKNLNCQHRSILAMIQIVIKYYDEEYRVQLL